MPELVGKKPVRVDGNGIKQYEDVKTVDYVELIPILTKSHTGTAGRDQRIKSNHREHE